MRLFGVIEPEPAMLWRVSDADSQIYLLGSVHLLRPTDYPLREIYAVAFDQVDGLAIEADVSQENAISNYVQENAFYSSGTISQDFSLSTITKLRTWFRQSGYQFSSQYQPWFLATLLLEVEVLSEGPFTASGVDVSFLEQANDRGLPVEYLESWQVALDYLTSMPPEIAEETVLEILNSGNQAINDLNFLIDQWSQSDLAAMEYYIDEEYNGGPQNPLSIAGRNLSWLSAVRDYLGDDRKFLIVVGAGHMVGEYGLPQLLENEGYKVERLPEEPWAELSNPQVDAQANILRTNIQGAMGRVCKIETSADLSDPNSWEVFDTFTFTDEQTTIEIPYSRTDDAMFVRGKIVE
ncbi:TraB/GumN family protein [Cerasicoccus arenae]|nr:TraB/GumN family protein [Cerasicoccus arenae]MBK1857757.1 TraB/GumN family protein [Cerasicoccus arenae]